jgi:hypothetical protein
MTTRISATARKALLSAGVAFTLGVFATSASAALFNPFTVDPDGAGGLAPFVADKITGNYVEVITFTPTSPTTGTFDLSIKWEAGQFVTNQGTTPLPAFQTGLGSTYALFALFQGSGTFTTAGGGADFSLNPGGSLQLYRTAVPPAVTFTQPLTGANPWTFSSPNPSSLLATGSATFGAGELDPSLPTCGAGGGQGINCGSFGQSTTFNLTPAGSNFFTLPVPFYNLSFQSGQFNNFQVAGTQVINGSLDAVFQTPEPGTMALLGLALLGFGLRRSATRE